MSAQATLVPLREALSTIESGKSIAAESRPANVGEYGVLKLSAVTWGRFRPEENKAFFPGHIPDPAITVRRGDLLISRANTTELVGAVALAEADYPNLALSDKTLRLVPNAHALPEYLIHALRQKYVRDYIEARATGTSGSMRNISQATLLDIPIPLPPLPEQKRIAAILDKADAIRRKRQEAIRLTEELLRSAFLEMFGDPVTNPKGWKTLPLGELVSNGPTNGLYKPASYYGRGVPIVRIDSFYDGELIDQLELKLLAASAEEVDRYRVSSGDVLINRVNSREYLGKSAFVRIDIANLVYESNMMRLTPDAHRLDGQYLVDLLQTGYIKGQIANCAKDAVNQASINQTDVRSFMIRCPPLPLQREWCDVRRVAARVLSRRRDADHSTRLVTALSQRAFSGGF